MQAVWNPRSDQRECATADYLPSLLGTSRWDLCGGHLMGWFLVLESPGCVCWWYKDLDTLAMLRVEAVYKV